MEPSRTLPCPSLPHSNSLGSWQRLSLSLQAPARETCLLGGSEVGEGVQRDEGTIPTTPQLGRG